MLFTQIKGKLVHQGGLVCAGMDFCATDVIKVFVWITIDELFAICHFVDHIVTLVKVNWMACFGKQDGDEAVIIAAFSLHSF